MQPHDYIANALNFSDLDLFEARRFNRRLAYAPRFKIRNRFTPRAIQLLLRIFQALGFRKLPDIGLQVEQKVVAIDGQQVAVRILRPQGPVTGVVLDIHGGGWVIGNARMNDQLNAGIITACNVAVVSVDYRLALETPVEGIIADCLTAAHWLLTNGLPEYGNLPVIIVGESAGGHLAAATLLRLKAWPHLLKRMVGAVLYYGVYDLAGTTSVRKAGPETLVLHGLSMATALGQLTPGMNNSERHNPSLSPLYGDLQGFPPALMYVGQIDPLRDDTMLMAERWKQVAQVELHLIPDAPHGFIHFPTRMAQQVLARTTAWINEQMRQTHRNLQVPSSKI